MVSTRSADKKGTPAKGGKAVPSPSPAGKGKGAAATPPAKRGAPAAAAASPAPASKAAAAAKRQPAAALSKKAKDASALRLLVAGDFVVTALWVFVSCLFSHAAAALIDLATEEDALLSLVSRGASFLSLGGGGSAAAEAVASFATDEFVVTLAVLCLAIVAFGPLCAIFGGALFNPVHNVAFWVAGRRTAAANGLRAASQVAGAALGAALAARLLPDLVSSSLPGSLKPGVDLALGCAVEFVLGAVLNVVVLYASATRSAAAAFCAPVLATVALAVAGASYTGPVLNPAQALAWYLQFGDAHPVEHHVLAFWASPIAGAVAGGLVYRYAVAPLTGAGGAARKAPAARRAAPAAVTPARATRATRAAAGTTKSKRA